MNDIGRDDISNWSHLGKGGFGDVSCVEIGAIKYALKSKKR